MENRIILGVYRLLDNRFEGLSDDSPRALELHNRRKDALHAVFDGDPIIQVTNWGKANDSRPHEYVELVLGVVSTVAFHYAIVPGIKWLGLMLAEKAVDTTLSEIAKRIISKLHPKQKAKQLLNITIKLPDNTEIIVDPPVQNATITIRFKDGSVQSLEYLKTSDQETG